MAKKKIVIPRFHGRVSLDKLIEDFPNCLKELAFGNYLYAKKKGDLNVVYNPKKEKIVVQPYAPRHLESTAFTTPMQSNSPTNPPLKQYRGSSKLKE